MDDDADYIVDLTFEISTTGYDPKRIGRMATRFARYLPEGARPCGGRWPPAGTPGVATISVRVPDTGGMTRALYAVSTALELTVADEPDDLFSLGAIHGAVINRVVPLL
jgi:hypothetical protein